MDQFRQTASSVTPLEFDQIKQRFQALGDRLTDAQLLDLADQYHDMLRWRRTSRGRLADRRFGGRAVDLSH